MPIHINDSLTRKLQEFLPIKPPRVNMYTCGVTVYDDCHIGHARSLYIFDVIRKYLKFRGFDIKFVRNITDIDDKIINRANELKVDWKILVDKYIARYYEDIESLGISKGDFEPRATENIPDMIEYIKKLIDKGFAYEAGGDVYFAVRKFSDYGKLSGQSIDQMEEGVRIDPSDLKKDYLDFALWKKSKEGEPFWSSPWGDGRPGWHIECSVMSQKFLKTDTLDIHAGGRDLIFPHHENEVAQAEALTGKPFAKYWIHHGLLTINGQKMSKSLGNFVTIKDALNKYPADVLKLFYLQAHYSSPVDYTDEKIKEAKQALERISILMDKISPPEAEIQNYGKAVKEIEDIRVKFVESMDSDFNTPKALACVFDLVNLTNKNINDYNFIINAYIMIKDLLKILGISLKEEFVSELISKEEVEAKIVQRNQARKDKDYALSDQIRKDLESKGIILEDTKDGKTGWRRKL